MRVRAFAKINRSLRVLGIRPDGYHDLRTEFQSIALHDTLVIDVRRGPFRLTCDDPECPSDETNLVWRAATHAWTAARRRGALRGVTIHLEKRIPLQGGLGGGSSDAAAALRGLGRLWRVDRRAQREIAAHLGADVPFFLDGGTMLGVERGDRLSRLPDARRAWVVLVIPEFGVSTMEAFGWWDLDVARRLHPSTKARGALSRVEGQPSAGRSPQGFALRGNDLEPVVAKRHPEISKLVAALKKSGATDAAMSGSGSAVFGLFSRQSAALDAAAALHRPGRRTLVTRTLDRAAYQRLAGR